MLAHNYLLWWIFQVVAVAILVFLALRWRPGFTGRRTIGEIARSALQSREDAIRAQLDAARESREEAARIHEQSQQDVDQARRQAEEILSRAGQTSAAIQKEMQARAEEEYQRIVGQARVQIDFERERAELALRRRAADIVVDAAGQIVREYLEPQSDRRIIDSSLENMKELR